MFDDKYIIPRNKLTQPNWVFYKDEADAIGKTGVGQKKDNLLAYKPWSDPTYTNSNRYEVFTGETSSEGFVTYWTLSNELAPLDDTRVKNFYRENDAWRAYEAMVENRYVFTRGVPWGYLIYVPKNETLEANFANKAEVEYGYPLKLNVANEAVILLPPYVSGKSEVVGIPYQKFIQGIPKVVKEDKIKVILGICNNGAFTYEDKIAAILKVVQSPDQTLDPISTGEGKSALQNQEINFKELDRAYKEVALGLPVNVMTEKYLSSLASSE